MVLNTLKCNCLTPLHFKRLTPFQRSCAVFWEKGPHFITREAAGFWAHNNTVIFTYLLIYFLTSLRQRYYVSAAEMYSTCDQ